MGAPMANIPFAEIADLMNRLLDKAADQRRQRNAQAGTKQTSPGRREVGQSVQLSFPTLRHRSMGLTRVRGTTSILLVGAAILVGTPAVSVAQARYDKIASCSRYCWSARSYDRCMSCCLDERASPSPFADPYIPRDYRLQRGRSSPGWQLCALLFELILRLLPELLGGFLGVVALMAHRLAKRRRDLRVAQDLDHKADVFRALADAIRKDHL